MLGKILFQNSLFINYLCTNYAEQSSWFNGGVGGGGARLFYTFTQ